MNVTYNGGVGCPAKGVDLPEEDPKAPDIRLCGEFLQRYGGEQTSRHNLAHAHTVKLEILAIQELKTFCSRLTLYQPMTHICVMSSHKPIRIYTGV